ncbi:MAG: aminoglycoside phosphotransferase family protein [Caldilineaceae bacterium]|nr:aminoglycoside phosphotransferase family protein [Caldilineaceae bacterium]
MYALSKTPVTRTTAQTLVATHCGSQATIDHYVELTDGMYNAAYLITLTDGQNAVLKVAPPVHVKVLRYERNIMQAEVDTLRLVRTHTTVPVPDIIAYDTSRRLLDNDYFLMTFVPGVGLHKLRPQLSADEQRASDGRTGAYLRQINALSGSRFGYVAQPTSHRATWRETFCTMLDQVLQDGRDAAVALPVAYDELATRLQPFYTALDAVTQPVLVHWDLWDGNIFVDPASKAITGLLDFERALWGDPLMEVNFGAFGVNPALIEGYGMDLLAAPGAPIRRTLYNIYLWLIMIIECTYRQYETDDQANWVRPKLVAELQNLP